MVFNGGFERLFLRFKKPMGNMLPREQRKLQPCVNDLMEILTLGNVDKPR